MRFLPSSLAAALITFAPAVSLAAISGDYVYNDDGTSITIVKYNNRAKTGPLVIPSTIAGKPVTAIGENAFLVCSKITSVTIPAGVTTVGRSAFEDCSSLSSVKLPEGLTTLGEFTFWGCWKLKTVHFPSTLTNLTDAFGGIDSILENVTFAPGTTSIPADVLKSSIQLTSVTIPSSVKRIEKNAFAYCESLESIKLPSGLTEIGEGAFRGSGLEKIKFPPSLSSIGDLAFRDTSLVRVTFPPSIREVGSFAFHRCRRLTTAVFTGEAPPQALDIFGGTSRDFKIFLEDSAFGFPVPDWGGDVTSWAAPEITINTLDGESLHSGKTVNLGNRYVGNKGPFHKAIITNTGIRPLTRIRVSISGSDASNFIIKTPKKKSLDPGKSMVVSVSFTPTKTGKKHATVVIRSNDKDEKSVSIYLSGRGYNKP